MRLLGVLVISAGLLFASAGSGMAGTVNCKQVNKYLQTGRSVKDVSETMVISESDVRKCQEEAASEGKAAPQQPSGEATQGSQPGQQETK